MKYLFYILLFFPFCLTAQVGIGTITPNASAMLDIESTVAGVLIPRLTQAQRLAIASPATGLLVFQDDTSKGFWYYNGTTWLTFSGGSGWDLTGNSGTTPATHFLGTSDNQDLAISTNNIERIRIKTNGNIGINEPNPIRKLHISGTNPVFRLEDGNEGANKVLMSDANGVVSWGTISIPSSSDADWQFISGSSYNDEVYHKGAVIIGRSGTTTHHLDVDNGLNVGTRIGIGDNEFIEDGNNETRFSHRLVPITDDAFKLGSATYRWNTVYATNGTIQTSDGRDKTSITPLTYGIESIMKLNPVTYKWKDERYLNHTIPEDKKELKLGLIAQELQQVIPEVVYTHSWTPKSEQENDVYIKVENEYLGVNYEELLAVLVKSKQEQQYKLELLKKETTELLKSVKQLKNK